MWSKVISSLGFIAKYLPIGMILKFCIGSFAVIILPKIVQYAFLSWGDQLLGFAVDKISSISGMQYTGLVIELTGFVGYVASKLKIVECLSVVITSSITIFFLSFFRK